MKKILLSSLLIFSIGFISTSTLVSMYNPITSNELNEKFEKAKWNGKNISDLLEKIKIEINNIKNLKEKENELNNKITNIKQIFFKKVATKIYNSKESRIPKIIKFNEELNKILDGFKIETKLHINTFYKFHGAYTSTAKIIAGRVTLNNFKKYLKWDNWLDMYFSDELAENIGKIIKKYQPNTHNAYIQIIVNKIKKILPDIYYTVTAKEIMAYDDKLIEIIESFHKISNELKDKINQN